MANPFSCSIPMMTALLAVVGACNEMAPGTPNGAAPCAGKCDGPGVVAPAVCTTRTPAVAVAETPPPSTMAPGSTAVPTITFANCGDSTWTAVAVGAADGFKLGSDAPRDNTTWTGGTRIALGSDVPPGFQITVAIPIQAPTMPGSYAYSWGVVHEGVAWLPSSSPVHTIQVASGATGGPTLTEICKNVSADTAGVLPASAALQTCVDAAHAGATLELPPGVYRMTSALVIDKPLTLRTAGVRDDQGACLTPGGPACAVLRADENLQVPRGFVRLGATSSVTLFHIAIDGNRARRLTSVAAQRCAQGDNGWGMNAGSPGCVGCAFMASASVNALCGSGMEWEGDQLTVAGSLFQDNGDHNTNSMWSDGLTLLRSDGATIVSNEFLNNSDIGLILGGSRNSVVQNNLIRQLSQGTWGGLMLDNFNGTTPGDFTGSVVSGNTIHCGPLLCDFGIELGPHPWYLSSNIIGGTVTQNTVDGAKFGLNVEGAGTDQNPIVVSGNNVGASPASASFNCGTRQSTTFNVSPDARVDLGSGPQPTGRFQFHGCQ